MFFWPARDASFSDQNCRVAPVAIKTFCRRQDKALRFEFKGGIFIEKVTHEPAILVGLNAARAVTDLPLWPYHLRRGSEQFPLFLDESLHRLRGYPVARLDPFGQHAGVRAGNIQKNGVEF